MEKKLSSKEKAKEIYNEVMTIFTSSASEEELELYCLKHGGRHYTWRNRILAFVGCNKKSLTPVYANKAEWAEEKVKPAVSDIEAVKICVPITAEHFFAYCGKTTLTQMNEYKAKLESFGLKNWNFKPYPNFFKIKDNEVGQIYIFPKPFSKPMQEYYSSLVKSGELVSVKTNGFDLQPKVYSIDQTDMPEKDRIDLLKRYNADFSKDNAYVDKVLARLNLVATALGLNVSDDEDKHTAAIGYVSYQNNEIYLKGDMPKIAKCGVLAHEIGHYVLQKNIDPYCYKYASSDFTHNTYEIQAELFSRSLLLSLNLKDNDDYNKRYIKGYVGALESGIKTTDKIRQVVFYNCFNIVDKGVDIMLDTLNMAGEHLNAACFPYLKGFIAPELELRKYKGSKTENYVKVIHRKDEMMYMPKKVLTESLTQEAVGQAVVDTAKVSTTKFESPKVIKPKKVKKTTKAKKVVKKKEMAAPEIEEPVAVAPETDEEDEMER